MFTNSTTKTHRVIMLTWTQVHSGRGQGYTSTCRSCLQAEEYGGLVTKQVWEHNVRQAG